MCKKTIIFIALMLFASGVYAQEFAPEFMELNVPEMVQYDFDGSILEIDFNIAGVGGKYYMVISTHGQGENIGWVQNGMLGWHTVNKIDTTITVAGPFTRDTGDVTLTWDGLDQDGEQVPEGTYKYLIWGYDSVNNRIPVTRYICAEYGWKTHFTYILENDTNGTPLANPIICGSMHHQNVVDDTEYLKAGVQKKWVVGGDPDDINNLLMTFCTIYPPNSERQNPGYMNHGLSVYNPYDHDIFYHCAYRVDSFTSTMLKWAFVNDGNAILDADWGGWDNITWDEDGSMGVWKVPMQSVIKDDIIYVQAADQTGVVAGDYNWLRAVDFDGDVVLENKMMEFFMPDDPNPTGADNCAMLDFSNGPAPNQLFLGTMGCCMHEMIHTTNMLEGATDEADYLMWRNGNGDFFFDAYWEPDAEVQWACLNNAEYVMHRIDSVATDSNGFNFIWSTYTGIYSFGVSCPDGSMIGMISLADDAIFDQTKNRGGGHIVDSGSAYDGMYMVRANAEGQVNGWASPETHWTAYDSASGLIVKDVSVEEEVITAFAVDQNTPNPFNPTTSIGFTIPEAGNVTVEIFNVAGQKIDTLVDDIMSAGHHSINWDASGISAGVYFYTVSSGKLSKTMKMTLLK